ncbi:asparaginase [Natranaerobius trueperi]|uniref:L-asparaginase n=1 Tax=Natranaerobius trueperi TaxID=759412 RepID=A0A226BXH6_9FIRM|nr:asparaginase [Natranaerobius trueperi]OWZ82817.1 L-asparaginase [Natranaerobius trueperi]
MGQSLIHKRRGQLVESVHKGTIAVVDQKGDLVASVGNPNKVTYWRSAAKPFQVIPLIQRGGIEKYDLNLKEISVMCASHMAQNIHTETVKEILSKIGLQESDLSCGTHPPGDKEVRNRLIRENSDPTEVYNNCSGKHSGMLALKELIQEKRKDYWKEDHPIQKLMIDIISKLTDVSLENVYIAKDGCGVPVYGMPIKNMAYAYSRFNDEKLPRDINLSLHIVQKAMTKHPEMVSGIGKFNTELMQSTKGKIIAKGGAQGVFCFAIPHKKLGVAIKVEDGSNEPISTITLEVLRQLQAITDDELGDLQKYYTQNITNAKKEKVGEIKPVFKLDYL